MHLTIEDYFVKKEPYYYELSNEKEIFRVAFKNHLPVLIKGPTGCGKTRFVEHMAYHLKKPLVTVNCHEDLSAGDLEGRFLLKNGETVWQDGPLTLAVKNGGICYLDEIVEARKDTTVIIHSLTDHRRILTIDKTQEVIEAHPDFMLVLTYNPGYQSIVKNLKQSTRQRFIAMDFDYPPLDIEVEIVQHESGIQYDLSQDLVKLGHEIRRMRKEGLEEGASTRLLIYAGKLIKDGIDPIRACEISMSSPLTDEKDHQNAIREVITDFFTPKLGI